MTVPELYKIYLDHPVVNTDTRCIKKNSVFFCLKGNNFNGNTFAEDAIDNGAAFAIIDDAEYLKNEKYILVENTLASLQELAKYHITQLKTQNPKLKIIGITGTNGKTTTKELIHAVLNRKYRTVATVGNLNNHIGVPLSLLSVNDKAEVAIIEMGANHPGEIAQLCEIACPDYGIITNIGIAHLEGFESFDNIIDTKKALYDFVGKANGLLFVNGDDSLLMKLSENMNRIFYGNSKDSVCSGKIIENNPFLKLNISLINKLTTHKLTNSQTHKLTTPNSLLIQTNIIGAYNLDNILAAICIGKFFKVSDEDIIQSLEDYKPDNYRSQFIDTGRNKILMDAYNANPTSMQLAINNFANLTLTTNNEQRTTNKIAIIGDMFELGKDSDTEHLKIIELLRTQQFEMIYLIGPQFTKAFNKSFSNNEQRITDNYKIFPDSESASIYLKNNPVTEKTILIEGSRGIKLEKLLDSL